MVFGAGGGSSNGEFIAAVYYDETATVSQVDLSQYTIDPAVEDGDYLVLDITNQRLAKGALPAGATYALNGDVHTYETPDGFVRMWGVAAGVNNITLPVEVKDINDCDINTKVQGTTQRHVQPHLANSTGTSLAVVRIGGTSASFGWSVFGERA